MRGSNLIGRARQVRRVTISEVVMPARMRQSVIAARQGGDLFSHAGAPSVKLLGTLTDRWSAMRVHRHQQVTVAATDARWITLLVFYLCTHHESSDYAAIAHGIDCPRYQPAHLKALPVAFPPLPIQRKIAAILSAYDDLIENNSRRIKLLEEMAKRIYREWFVDFRYPGHEDCPAGGFGAGTDSARAGRSASAMSRAGDGRHSGIRSRRLTSGRGSSRFREDGHLHGIAYRLG